MKPHRIYVRRGTKAYDDIAEFMRIYGLRPDLGIDDVGTYVDVTPPDYWGRYRRARFQDGLEQFESLSR